MPPLFTITPVDREFYESRVRDFLPERLVDIHTHVWREDLRGPESKKDSRTVSWPALVAGENPIEDLLETYNLLLPGKEVTPLIFATLPRGPDDLTPMNEYVAECGRKHQVPTLVFSNPAWDAQTLEAELRAGGFLGAKSYLSMCPADKPADQITIFDFFPHHHLEVLDRLGLIMMLHIPRPGRLRDQKNLEQILEIEERYPNLHLIVAHVGRAYCNEDVGDALEQLSGTSRLVFDFCANTNAWVFARCLEAVGPRRMLWGTDLPILRMRMRRICENGKYVNLVPKGLYGDVSNDPNMREVDGKEAEKLSFFLYEEIDAMRRACGELGLGRKDIEDMFCNNAEKILLAVKKQGGETR